MNMLLIICRVIPRHPTKTKTVIQMYYPNEYHILNCCNLRKNKTYFLNIVCAGFVSCVFHYVAMCSTFHMSNYISDPFLQIYCRHDVYNGLFYHPSGVWLTQYECL